MATPNDIAIEDMTGTWYMDKSLSCDTGAMLALQGLSWFVRKAIGLATVTIKLTQAPGTNPSTSAPTIEITVLQSTGTSLGATTDKLYLDWTELKRDDNIFGKTFAQARFVTGAPSSDGKTRPDLNVQTKVDDPNIAKFLRGEIGEDLKPCEGFLVEAPKKEFPGVNGQAGLWTQVLIRSQDGKWTAEQIWGFEIINGVRHYVRRTAVTDDKGKFQLGRVVYTFKGRD